MSTTDTTKSGLEALIVQHFITKSGDTEGASRGYDREDAVDVAKLRAFLSIIHPKLAAMNLRHEISRGNILRRLQSKDSRHAVPNMLLQSSVQGFSGDLYRRSA